jgi:hypothetical protein
LSVNQRTKPGKWSSEQAGVNAPVTATNTVFLSENNSFAGTGWGLPPSNLEKVTARMQSPKFLFIDRQDKISVHLDRRK